MSDTPDTRLEFPEDEARFDWLAPLLEAAAQIDAGVAVALRAATGRGHTLACGRAVPPAAAVTARCR